MRRLRPRYPRVLIWLVLVSLTGLAPAGHRWPTGPFAFAQPPAGLEPANQPLVSLASTATEIASATPTVTLTPTFTPTVTPSSTATPLPTTQPQPRPVIRLSLAASPAEVSPGDALTYTLRLANAGPVRVTHLVISDTLPAGLRYVPGSAGGGRYDPPSRRLTWTLAGLDPRAEATFGFQARVLPAAPNPILNTVEVASPDFRGQPTATASVHVLHTAEQVVRPGAPTRMTAPGGRVWVDFPAGAVTQAVWVHYRSLAARRLTAGRIGLALQFELTAQPTTGGENAPPITRFQKPLRLTVDLTGLVDVETLGKYRKPFVGYRDEATGRWVPLPVVEQQFDRPVLTVEVGHFSAFGGGADGEVEWGWTLTFNDATVGNFDGGLGYHYPIQVVPGRADLTPQLNLSYHSRRMDGVLSWVQSDWTGLGWTVGAVEILRQGVQRCWQDNWICYENEFVLVLNGTAYELEPAVQGQNYGRYHTADESFLYIERRNAAGSDGSSENATSEYWILRTKDGTTYELGKTANSEQVFGPYAKSGGQPAFGYVGTHPGLAAFRWRVDQATDPHGNRIDYSYYKETKAYQCANEPAWPACQGVLDDNSERANYLDRIEYNHRANGQPGAQVIFQRAGRGSDVDDLTAPRAYGQSGLPLAVFWQRHYLQSIQVQAYDAPTGNWVTLREDRFAYGTFIPADEGNKRLRVLTTVQAWAPQGAGWVAQPALTLGYQGYQNKAWCNCSGTEWQEARFYYPRLSQVDNGHGGVINIQYETPDSGYDHAFNYRAFHRETRDSGTPVRQADYTYPGLKADRCYDNNDDHICEFFDDGNQWDVSGGKLVGYKWSSETLKARTRYHYDLVDPNDPVPQPRAWTDPPTAGLLTQVDAWNGGLTGNGGQDYSITGYRYDPAYGNPISTTDPLSRTTTTEYDDLFHTYPITQTNAVGQTITQYYGVENGSSATGSGAFFGAVEAVTDANGASSRYTYDASGRLTKVIQPGDSVSLPTVESIYDDFYAGPTTRVQTFYRETSGCSGCVRPVLKFYDGLGRLIQTKAESQDGTQMGVTNLTYDARGRVAEEYVPYFVDGSATFWEYVTPDATKPKTSYAYDALGRPTLLTHPDGRTVQTSYAGWRTTVVDENGHQRAHERDAYGRLAKVEEYTGTDPYSLYATTTYAYNVLDLLTVVTDTTGITTTVSYDPLGRKTSMGDPDMGAWSYDYDAAGNLTRQTDARGQTICFYYDALNRLMGKHYRSDPACPTSNPGLSVRYTYDDGPYGVGRRTGMSDDSGSTTWGYDARGRVVTETQLIGVLGVYTTTYGYDSQDRPVSMAHPDGEVITTTYTAMGRPATLVSSLGETYVAGATYNALGQPKTIQLGHGLVTRFGYYGYNGFGMGDGDDAPDDPTWANGHVGRLWKLCTLPAGQACPQAGSESSVLDLRYSYDGVGNILNLRDKSGGGEELQTFTYDDLDRLTGASGAYSETYGYSGNDGTIGNLTFKTGVGSYTYGASVSGCSAGTPATKPHAVAGTDSYSFSYDCNGNMVQRAVGTSYTLGYDAENRLQSVTNTATGDVVTFTYDGDGRRVLRDTDTQTTAYAGPHYELRFNKTNKPEDLDGDCVVTVTDIMQVASRWGEGSGSPGDLNGDGTVDVGDIQQVAGAWRETCHALADTTQYYALGGRRVAMRKAGTLYYLFTDHLGSTSVAYNTANGQVQTIRYYPWGEVRSGDVPTNRRFTGQRWDATIGLYDYNARWYEPALGRFVQPDTIVPAPGNPQSLNRYSYVLNNPLRYTDPSGHAMACGIAGEGCGSSYTPSSPLSDEDIAAVLNRLRRMVTGPTLGSVNVLPNLPAIVYSSNQYQVDPRLVAASVYYESDAIERLLTNLTSSPLLDFDLWKLALTGEASIGVGQVRVDTALALEEVGFIQPTTPDLPGIGQRPLIALRLRDDVENIRYVAANLAFIQRGVEENAAGLALSPDQKQALVVAGYNVGRQEIVRALQEAQRGNLQALQDYVAWPYAQRDVLPIHGFFQRIVP